MTAVTERRASLVVTRCDLRVDREAVVDTLRRYLTPDSNTRRFDWLYRDNPHGPAAAWLLREAGGRDVIGAAAAFPRRVLVNGFPGIGWVLGDFCVSDRHRSLGPAVTLQRACLDVLRTDSGEFCYDFPSPAMMAVYRRLGLSASSRLIRFAKPLRIDRKVNDAIPVPWLGNVIRMAGNAALKIIDSAKTSANGVVCGIHAGSCGEEFGALTGVGELGRRIAVERSPAYLNWRYVQNPLTPHHFLAARRAGALVGYAVFAQAGEDATMVDCVSGGDAHLALLLVERLTELLRNKGVMTLSAHVVESHPLVPVLRRAGFRPREATPMVVYPPAYAAGLSAVDWCLMSGDRDS
jgi:hypothetical protein